MARWGRCDIRQLQRLQEQLADLEQIDVDTLCKKCVKEVAGRLLSGVVRRTPVGQYPPSTGKVGGTLRRGWNGRAGGVAARAASLPITKSGHTYQTQIDNQVEYASYVEYGHRTRDHSGWVPGEHMLTIAADQVDAQVPKIIDRQVRRYLEGCFRD